MSTQSNAAIVSIGAVKYDETGIHDEFHVAISLADCLKYGLHKSDDTVKWWKSQPLEVVQAWAVNGQPLKESLEKFLAWLGPDYAKYEYYCWGLNFDAPILDNALSVVGYQVPWKYWNLRCARTIHAVLSTGFIEKRDGHYHNALDDAKTQALEMIKLSAPQ